MKQRGLVTNSYIHISGSDLYIPKMGLIWNICFPLLYCMRELSAQPHERREGQGTAAKQWLVAVPCPPFPSCGWAESLHKWLTYKFPIWKITDHKWKQLNHVVNFLFGLRVILTGPPFVVHFFPNPIPYKSTHLSFAHTSGHPSRPTSTTSHISL